MLRGRESLVRLVGKRRRFLPNRDSLLSSSSSSIESCLSLYSVKGSGVMLKDSSEGYAMADGSDFFGNKVGNVDESEEVICPVCGDSIRGNNFTVNSHIDVCLSGGRKRKLTQPTLLEMNFFSPPKVQVLSPKRKYLGNNLPLCNRDENTVLRNFSYGLPDFDGVEEEEDSGSLSEFLQHSEPVGKLHVDDNNRDDNCDTNSFFVKNKGSESDVSVELDDISDVLLETLIVGRKFSDVKEINPRESILLVRDPCNVKDPNAVKVVSADSGVPKALGFLPRELAQYLSPLIDKYRLDFEGRVTSLPKNSLEHVPVQFSCHKAKSDENKENDNIELFRYLWRNVQQVIESTKNCRTSATKYQQNFSVLVQEVLQSNLHLFIDGEKDFVESFNNFPDDSQRLFVRLYTRKGPWFRMSNIFYPEISDPQKAIEQLAVKGYIHCFDDKNELHHDDVSDILNLLTVAELREIMSILKQRCNGGTRKQELVESLVSSYQDGLCPTLQSTILERTGACIRISSFAESLFWRIERLFFLNGEQDLSSFLLADLGIIKYPTYKCLITEPIFSHRNDLLAYEEAIEVAQLIDQALDGQDNEGVSKCIKIAESRISNASAKVTESSVAESLVTFRSSYSASWVYAKVLTLGVSFLEHVRRYNEAIQLLKWLLDCFASGGRRGYWILRLSVDLEHIGHHDESLSVAESGLQDTWVRAGSRMALQRRILRLAKPPRRWKTPSFANSVNRKIKEVHVLGRPLNSVTGMKSRFYGEDGEQCGVEQLALQYYIGEGGGWQGVHTESGIWLTIFGLLMWDIMFSDVPNVFRTQFQTAPLDLETDNFYLTRKSSIESHVQKIHDGMAEEMIITSWETHNGTACRGINWNRHTLSELRAAVACIGGPCLASLCRHLAQDYRSWSSGMPDLLLWRFDGEFGAEAKLVEVKGPRDRLSEQQRAWLLLLMDCGFHTEVCKVGPGPDAS